MERPVRMNVQAAKRRKRKKARRVFTLALVLLLAGVCALLIRLLWSNGVFAARWLPGKDAPTDYLVLVNWEHPLKGEAANLAPLSDVMESSVVLMDDSRQKVERTAGRAAFQMFEAAREEGVGKFIVNSAYRSMQTQTAIWQNRIAQDPNYGSDPYNNPVRAMPGDRSEHSTGLAMDILCESHNCADDAYGKTAQGQWLAQNAHRFGFILRYPEEKEHLTGVIYEPWHFRYVGIDAATEIYERGLCLEEYLGDSGGN